MTSEKVTCQACQRKVTQTVTNRCMYCGADLPEEHHLTAEEKNRLLNEKLEQFRRNEENAEELISGMRQNFDIAAPRPKKKTRKEKRADKSQAVNDALSDIHNHLEQIRREREAAKPADNPTDNPASNPASNPAKKPTDNSNDNQPR